MDRARIGYSRDMARSVLKECCIKNPWVDLKKIVEEKGFIYLEVDTFPDEIDAIFLSQDTLTYAAVNSRHHPHRKRFSLAHELGHLLLNHKISYYEPNISLDNPPVTKAHTAIEKFFEQEANTFAGELLVPFEILKIEFKKTNDITELSKIFFVSKAVITIAIENYARYLFK